MENAYTIFHYILFMITTDCGFEQAMQENSSAQQFNTEKHSRTIRTIKSVTFRKKSKINRFYMMLQSAKLYSSDSSTKHQNKPKKFRQVDTSKICFI